MRIRAIAFYLPQFHPIPENDTWWGKGFTDWRNVSKAKPAFKGHYQPHLPADLGFYDLRRPEARQAQADLAREYGIHGFCYYHYWFNGRRLLERPFNEVLSSGKPDFPFCLCWANESWTRLWDGQEQEVLMAQSYSEEDDLNHIRWLAGAFRDPRYIQVRGRPLFLVYRLSRLPDPGRTLEVWRNEARRLGVGDIFICNVESFIADHGLALQYNLDGAVEFAPDHNEAPRRQEANKLTRNLWRWPRIQRVAAMLESAQPGFSTHAVLSYAELMNNMIAKPQPPYLRFPCVMPSWDNAARRQEGANIFHGSTPKLYQQWLDAAVQKAKSVNKDDPIVFINAWNEWAEGNHLEPCQKWRHAYLRATRNALKTATVSYPNHSTVLKVPKISSLNTSSPRPFWSVMIPVYNPRLPYLEETLRCVLDQDTGADQMQIEVIDDASSNGAPKEFIRKLAGERVTIHCEPCNLGLAGIWNRCIERARGEWVHILHQDDLVFPGFYQSLRAGVEKFPQAGAAICRHAYCDENGHWHQLSILEMPSPGLLQNFVEPLVTAIRVECAAIAVRRSTYEQLGGFNADLKCALDWEMWIRIANKFPFFYEPRILACWRNHAGATSTPQIHSAENIRDITKAIGIWRKHLPAAERQRLAEIAANHFSREGFRLARYWLGQNDFEASLNQLEAALACKSSLRLQLSAAKIRAKIYAKRILKWRQARLASASS